MTTHQLVEPVLVCANGSPWGRYGCGPCAKCVTECDRLEAQFWRNVFFGLYDADGYTAADRKRQVKAAR
jgi:hypothetical protein